MAAVLLPLLAAELEQIAVIGADELFAAAEVFQGMGDFGEGVHGQP